MLKSMTGYGLSRLITDEIEVEVEIKSLNSKFLEVNLKTGSWFSDKEAELKNLIQQRLERGKVFLSIALRDKTHQLNIAQLNEPLAIAYYRQFEALARQLGADHKDLLRLVLTQPDVIMRSQNVEALERQWQLVLGQVVAAIENCEQFRIQEGKAMESKIAASLQAIEAALAEIEQLDPQRIVRLRNKLQAQIAEIKTANPDRFEQEMIFYIEKLDISEEKNRLANHLNYFAECMKAHDSSGRKLGFIAQEIGREINTLGAKACDAAIQRLVVCMKDELEKIKEQLNNVL